MAERTEPVADLPPSYTPQVVTQAVRYDITGSDAETAPPRAVVMPRPSFLPPPPGYSVPFLPGVHPMPLPVMRPPPAAAPSVSTALTVPEPIGWFKLEWTPAMNKKFMDFLDSPDYDRMKSNQPATKSAGLWAAIGRELASRHTCFVLAANHPSVIKDPRNGVGVPYKKHVRVPAYRSAGAQQGAPCTLAS